MTPWQLGELLRAETDERAHRHDMRAWLAWHTAALHRTKKMPPLKDMLRRRDKDKGSVDIRLKAMLKASFPSKPKA